MEKERIQFKPLHDGMGFHPFSDGLPYAPESKNPVKPAQKATQKSAAPQSWMGTGATAAGRPQFATARQLKELQDRAPLSIPTSNPQTLAPQIVTTHLRSGQIPKVSTRPARPEALDLKTLKDSPSASLKSASLNSAAQTSAAPSLGADASNSLTRRRVFAYLMDSVIHAGFWLSTNLAALFFFNFQLDANIVSEHLSQFLIFFIVSQWLFIALQEILFETTVGKAFFNLEFKRTHGSLFLRSIVFMVGLLAMGLGLFYRPQDRLGQLQLTTRLYS
jgi:hypothetical protein